MYSEITGLSHKQVTKLIERGKVNTKQNTNSPSYLWITIRNLFNLINVALIPLLGLLIYFGKYQEVFTISVFAIVNSVLSIFDEARIKKRLDEIQVDFSPKVTVIRDGNQSEIYTYEIVEGDTIIIHEGEGIPTDGTVVMAQNLQVDESLLTGESNYIAKDKGEDLIGGSFVVTGEVVYQAHTVGKDSYINKLGAQSRSFHKEKSNLQKISDKLVIFFVIAAVIFGIASYFVAFNTNGNNVGNAVIPMTTVVMLIIPQTLIFLFTFSFSIAVVKLSNKGVLVQRPSAVESLAQLDVLCLDKTGTITSGEMQLQDSEYWNTDAEEIRPLFRFLSHKAFGKNKTFEAITKYFRKQKGDEVNIAEFTQIPFNSKVKIAKNQFQLAESKYAQLIYGAPNVVISFVDTKLKSEIEAKIEAAQTQGLRTILGVINYSNQDLDLTSLNITTDKVFLLILKEELNKGIVDVVNRIKELGVDLKVISGDSYLAISRIMQNANMDIGEAIDLSEYKGDLAKIAHKYSIFARAKPEDKLSLIRIFKDQGHKVGMVGDGVNDVLALKLSNLSIAMESGAKIAQNVSDIVLLNNDFTLVPQIIFEGDNVIANLKFTTLLFMTKTFHAILYALSAILLNLVFPILPAATLIYSFLTTSLPSYAVAFFRQEVSTSKNFWRELLPASLWSSVIATGLSLYIHLQFVNADKQFLNTMIIYGLTAYALLFAIDCLWRGGYLTKWYQPVVVFVVIAIASFVPTIIPFLNVYYNVSSIRIENWLWTYIPGGVSYLIYLIGVTLAEWIKRLQK